MTGRQGGRDLNCRKYWVAIFGTKEGKLSISNSKGFQNWKGRNKLTIILGV